MSDKIYELIKQSEVSISHPKCFTGYIDINKFAELIVRECADIARGWSDDYVVEDTAPRQIDALIKQHFGVEE
jgi:hypothetical protein